MRVPRATVPVLVVLAAAAGIAASRLVAAPSLSRTYDASPAARAAEARFIVRGLRCVDTARRFAAQLEGTPGVGTCVAYASRREAVVRFDPARTGARALHAAIESPSIDAVTGAIEFHPFDVVSIDGRPVVDDAQTP
jgi:hypothetical protein